MADDKVKPLDEALRLLNKAKQVRLANMLQLIRMRAMTVMNLSTRLAAKKGDNDAQSALISYLIIRVCALEAAPAQRDIVFVDTGEEVFKE